MRASRRSLSVCSLKRCMSMHAFSTCSLQSMHQNLIQILDKTLQMYSTTLQCMSIHPSIKPILAPSPCNPPPLGCFLPDRLFPLRYQLLQQPQPSLPLLRGFLAEKLARHALQGERAHNLNSTEENRFTP